MLKQNFLLFSLKFTEYIFSAESACSNPCVGILPRIKISFFLLWIFVDELISTPKIITFRPVPTLGRGKNPCLSNPIPYPKYLYWSISSVLVKLTAPNKPFYSVG